MEHIGIIGGSFDPIHIGHLITAQSVLEKRKLDKIIFIPCYVSPHKLQNKTTEANYRMEMVKLAIESNPNFTVSDFEIKMNKVSYTVETLEHFSEIYDNIDFIIGYDNLINFNQWKNPDKIVELANLVVLKRNFVAPSYSFHSYFAKAIFVDTPIVEISSTEIRERIVKRLPVNYFLTKEVNEYIIEHGLYKRKR
jgi:nicotinate-nucleotide adenylyltransferase